MKELIISPIYERNRSDIGLGDTLIYSHIPRIAKTQYDYDRVWISKMVYRNHETQELVWDLNPYVDGYVDANGIKETCLLNIWSDSDFYNQVGTNFMDKIMYRFGFDDGCVNHLPEIYYKPKIIKELQGKSLYDPNYHSTAGCLDINLLNEYLTKNNIRFDKLLPYRKGNGKHYEYPFDFSVYEINNIYDYLDALSSTSDFHCLFSGGSVVSAVYNGCTSYLSSLLHINSFNWEFKNNKYIRL